MGKYKHEIINKCVCVGGGGGRSLGLEHNYSPDCIFFWGGGGGG